MTWHGQVREPLTTACAARYYGVSTRPEPGEQQAGRPRWELPAPALRFRICPRLLQQFRTASQDRTVWRFMALAQLLSPSCGSSPPARHSSTMSARRPPPTPWPRGRRLWLRPPQGTVRPAAGVAGTAARRRAATAATGAANSCHRVLHHAGALRGRLELAPHGMGHGSGSAGLCVSGGLCADVPSARLALLSPGAGLFGRGGGGLRGASVPARRPFPSGLLLSHRLAGVATAAFHHGTPALPGERAGAHVSRRTLKLAA